MTEIRARITIHGAVQGVGFRPFVYRLAHAMKIRGNVSNSLQGVYIEAEGPQPVVDYFISCLSKDHPANASIQSLEISYLNPAGYTVFEICESSQRGKAIAFVLPDISTCADCLGEVFNPADRRYLYPFTNCMNCGPRFTIIEALPYDRQNTAMKRFEMCFTCRAEYEDAADRRFHAQPNACPECGPHVELWNQDGSVAASSDEAIDKTLEMILNDKIVAVKGLGGFHLIVDARNNSAIQILRERKHRKEKPFALLFPDIESVRLNCEISSLEERLLLSREAPIVLLPKKMNRALAATVAPGNPYYGAMLPYTPLHHILLRKLNSPVVATSGNVSEEPICIDEQEALQRLSGIADYFLVHDRPIVRPVDDSILQVILGREQLLRRSRGYAPLPVVMQDAARTAIQTLAVGGHLKNTIALHAGNSLFVSQHIGDLETGQAFESFQCTIRSLQKMFRIEPDRIVCDMHPDYLSTKYAANAEVPIIQIQHHYAHVCSCMAENKLQGSLLGVAWDGTGYGTDGTVWGGEFLETTETDFQRVASFRLFPLPGGACAIREPRRTGLAILHHVLGEELFERFDLPVIQAFDRIELKIIKQILEKKVNSPQTSSVGRLFDAIASILGIRQIASYEGQAAMELEFATKDNESELSYTLGTSKNEELCRIDWEPTIVEILDDQKLSVSKGVIASKFHNTLVDSIMKIAERSGQERIVLSGGCFQNRYLLDRAVTTLNAKGFRAYWHRHIPPNDGGIAPGQIYASLRATPGIC